MMAHPLALQLRNLQSLIEIGVDKNTTVVFPAPLMSTIGDLGAFLRRETLAACLGPRGTVPEADAAGAASDVGHDLLGDQPQVVEVGEVEHLQVDALGAERGVPAELVHDLRGRAGQAVLPQLGLVAADRRGAPVQLGLVPADAEHQRVGPDQLVRVAAGLLAGLADPVELVAGRPRPTNGRLNSSA